MTHSYAAMAIIIKEGRKEKAILFKESSLQINTSTSSIPDMHTTAHGIDNSGYIPSLSRRS
jgi:hypothetical protein